MNNLVALRDQDIVRGAQRDALIAYIPVSIPAYSLVCGPYS